MTDEIPRNKPFKKMFDVNFIAKRLTYNWMDSLISIDGKASGRLVEEPVYKIELKYADSHGVDMILQDIYFEKLISFTKEVLVYRSANTGEVVTVRIVEEIKPEPIKIEYDCPYCGNKVRTVSKNVAKFPSLLRYDIACSNKKCYITKGTGHEFDSEEEAIKTWNDSLK